MHSLGAPTNQGSSSCRTRPNARSRPGPSTGRFSCSIPKWCSRSGLATQTLAAEQLETAKSTLAVARTEGVVHLGAARKDEGFDKPRLTLRMQISRPGSTSPENVKIVVGRGDDWRDTSVFYVRREGVEATFAIAQGNIRPLLDLR